MFLVSKNKPGATMKRFFPGVLISTMGTARSIPGGGGRGGGPSLRRMSGPPSLPRSLRSFSTYSRNALYSVGESFPSPSLSNCIMNFLRASWRAARASFTSRALSSSDKTPVPVLSYSSSTIWRISRVTCRLSKPGLCTGGTALRSSAAGASIRAAACGRKPHASAAAHDRMKGWNNLMVILINPAWKRRFQK